MGPFPHTWSHGDPDFVTGPMANSVQSTWHQYLRRLATYTCLCFGLAGAREIGETSYTFSDMEWLRIYNAAVKRGGMLHQNYYVGWLHDGHDQPQR